MAWFFDITQWTGTEGIGEDQSGADRKGGERIGLVLCPYTVEWSGSEWPASERKGADWFFALTQRSGPEGH